VTKSIKQENLSFVEAVDEGFELVSDELHEEDEKILPGFGIAKGLQPILPLRLNGLTLGSPEQCELSAVVCLTLLFLRSFPHIFHISVSHHCKLSA
jgi:hypothetical protein